MKKLPSQWHLWLWEKNVATLAPFHDSKKKIKNRRKLNWIWSRAPCPCDPATATASAAWLMGLASFGCHLLATAYLAFNSTEDTSKNHSMPFHDITQTNGAWFCLLKSHMELSYYSLAFVWIGNERWKVIDLIPCHSYLCLIFV